MMLDNSFFQGALAMAKKLAPFGCDVAKSVGEQFGRHMHDNLDPLARSTLAAFCDEAAKELRR